MEIWKETEYDNYEVSNLGRIRNKTTKYVKKCSKIKNTGYYKCGLSLEGVSKTVYVHRLVAKAFVPNPNNYPEVNHIDGNKENNVAENLEWVTRHQNLVHARNNKLTSTRKLNLEQVNFIRNSNDTTINLAKEFNVTRETISKIKNNHIWVD